MLELVHKHAVSKRNRGLGCKGRRQTLIIFRKYGNIATTIFGVEQLQHANYFALVVLHGDGEERCRAVTGFFIEVARARKIEAIPLRATRASIR